MNLSKQENKNNLETIQKMKKENEDINIRINSNKDQFDNKIKELADELNKREQKITLLLNNEKNLKSEIAKNKTEVDKLKEEINKLKEEKDKLKEGINKENFKNENNQNEINKLKGEINSYKNKLNINEEKLKESNKTINELKNQLNNDKLKEDETIKNLKINQEKEIENLKNQLLAEKNNAEIFNKKFEELKADYEKKIISLNEQLKIFSRFTK